MITKIPFDRLSHDDSIAIKCYIGEYVSHDVVRDWRRQYLYSVEELNEMDRKSLATTWYNSDIWKKKRWDVLISSFYKGDVEAFLDEAARYIDDRIPRAYLEYHAKGDASFVNGVECNKDGNPTTGLIYHYPENKNAPTFVIGATDRQVSYLIDLATKKGLQFCWEGMSKDEASECIGYFVHNAKPEPACFQKYFKVRCKDTPEDDSQDVQMEKIEWFAEREGKNIASKFQRICADVQCTDFNKMDHHSIYEARNLIIAIAESHGLQWDKTDCCVDCYSFEGNLRIGPKFLSYDIGVCIDYYDIPTEEIWKKMPVMVIEQFGAMTPEKVTEIIREELVSKIKLERDS